MAFRFFVLCATLAYVNAGGIYETGPALAYSAPAISYGATYGAPLSYSAPAITSQSQNIYRTAGNLGQISTYSKTIDTPFSSVSKSDVRVSNPGLKIAAAPAYAYSAAPAYTYGASPAYAYSAPAPVLHHSAPIAHASPLLGVAYSAAPAVSHINYDSGYAHYAF